MATKRTKRLLDVQSVTVDERRAQVDEAGARALAVSDALQVVDCADSAQGDGWALYNADAVLLARQLPSNSVGLSVYSPPFSSVYTYSAYAEDFGNCVNDAQFFEQYRHLIREQYRVLIPGRLVAVHCKQLVDYRGRDGRAGLRDFRGEIIRAFEAEGFKYHSEVCIWTDPVLEMQRTKAHGLLYKQLRADSSFSRQGLAEYVCTFRKWTDGEDSNGPVPVTHTEHDFTLDEWQQVASCVWVNVKPGPSADGHADLMVPGEDIRRTDVLNVQQAREDKDEKHMCPLQLSVIDRCVRLWSNPGDVVWSPFSGIGSEGVGALKRGRKFIGTELKPAYFKLAARNLAAAEPNAAGSQTSLFGL